MIKNFDAKDMEIIETLLRFSGRLKTDQYISMTRCNKCAICMLPRCNACDNCLFKHRKKSCISKNNCLFLSYHIRTRYKQLPRTEVKKILFKINNSNCTINNSNRIMNKLNGTLDNLDKVNNLNGTLDNFNGTLYNPNVNNLINYTNNKIT